MNILIVTNGGIGDQIHFSSLIKGLHRKYKNPKITIFCHPQLEFIYRHDENIHHIVSNLSGFEFNVGYNFALRKDLIQLFSNVPIKKRIGFALNEDGQLWGTNAEAQNLMLTATGKLQTDRCLGEWMCKIAGVKWTPPYFCYPKSEKKYNIDVVLQYGTNIEEKNWDSSYYMQFLEVILKNKSVCITAHKKHENIVHDIRYTLKNRKVNVNNLKIMIGDNEDLYEVANLLSQSKCLVSPDTSIVHVALAVGTKAIVLSNGYDRGFAFSKKMKNLTMVKHRRMEDILPISLYKHMPMDLMEIIS